MWGTRSAVHVGACSRPIENRYVHIRPNGSGLANGGTIHFVFKEFSVPNKDPVDVHIGTRLRSAREARHMTLGQVGRDLSLTYQQIRKYESGENRLSASRLYQLSILLKVEPAYFFRGLDGASDGIMGKASDDPALSAALDRIGNPEVRRHLKGLIDVLDIDLSPERPAVSSPQGTVS